MLTILSARDNINDYLRQGETPGFPSASMGGGLLLESLVDKGLVMKHEKSRGVLEANFGYSLSQTLMRHISLILSEPSPEFVSLSFSRLRHLCRVEKCGYFKKIKRIYEPQNVPKSQQEKEHLKTKLMTLCVRHRRNTLIYPR